MSKYVLGIWGYSADSSAITHDSGAALIKDGKVVAVINEERLSRKKIDGSYPFKSIKKVCEIANISPEQVDLVALAGLSPRRRSLKMLKYIMRTRKETGVKLWNRIKYALLTAKKIKRTVPKELSKAKIVNVDHHMAHAASGYYTCPWNEATVVTLDGIGDSSACGVVCTGKDGKLEKHWECNGYYSPGIFYTFITKRFGFSPSKHEGKITGLAAYGDPKKTIDKMSTILKYDSEKHDFFSEYIPQLFEAKGYGEWNLPIIDELLDEVTREHVAAGLQKLTEDVVCDYITDAVKKTGIKNVALSGGVFSNVKVNQRIAELDCVDGIYIHPNMGDGGLTVGSAYYAWAEDKIKEGEKSNPTFLPNVYLGPNFKESEIEEEIKKSGLRYEKYEEVEKEIAKLIHGNKIVGRFAGRMEYGPRALGNRSILAAPIDKTINDWLNERLKRTEFMPFAPSILEEDSHLFYKGWNKEHYAARFMTVTYDVSKEQGDKVPAVTHIDYTARPQVVRKEDNLSYHKIISAYKELSGLPVVINTSFNMHEEPIVCTPNDAIRSLKHGAVDVLAIENFLVYPEK